MKGLLIKDFRLLKGQVYFLLIVTVCDCFYDKWKRSVWRGLCMFHGGITFTYNSQL
jgi:hypothetical protein